jgi:hypothetical protein
MKNIFAERSVSCDFETAYACTPKLSADSVAFGGNGGCPRTLPLRQGPGLIRK